MTCQADCFRDNTCHGCIRPVNAPTRLVWGYFRINEGGELEARQFTDCQCGCGKLVANPSVGVDLHASLQTTRQDDEETLQATSSLGQEITSEEKGPANRRVSLLARCVFPIADAMGLSQIKRFLNQKRKMSLRAHWILRVMAILLIAILWYWSK